MINLFSSIVLITDDPNALSGVFLQALKMANDSAWVKKRFAQLSASSKVEVFLKETSQAFNITLKMLRSSNTKTVSISKSLLYSYDIVST